MDKKELPLKMRIYHFIKKLFSPFKKKKLKGDRSRFSKSTIHYKIECNGMTRDYYVFDPVRQEENKQLPLYIALHGLTGTASTQIRASLLPLICELNGGIVACPQGLEDVGMTGWNAGVEHYISGKNIKLHGNYDDVGFINIMIDDLLSKYPIDEDKIFVLGFSMGGFLVNRLAIECGDRFRAFCSINGTIGNLLWGKEPKCPINILHIHGTADDSVRYLPTPTKHHKPHGIGAEQLVEFWRNHNGCTSNPHIFDYPHMTDNDVTFQIREYSGGKNGAKTAFIKVTNGVHTFYDGFNHDISSMVEIMRFFANAPLLRQKKQTRAQ